MTVVLAKLIDDMVVLMSDTMITDDEKGKRDAIPGRAKIVILNDHITIAFAGHANQAIDILRHISSEQKNDIGLLRSYLRDNTQCRDFDVEFLLVVHQPTASLRKIWSGTISDELTFAWIGNSTIIAEFERRLAVQSDNTLEKAKAVQIAFLTAFTATDPHLGSGVGGVPIFVFAEPSGHYYKWYMYNFNWKPIHFVPGTVTFEDEADLITGEWSWHLTVVAPSLKGVACFAVVILQAKMAFVYQPLVHDDARVLRLLDPKKQWVDHQREMYDTLQAELDKIAKTLRIES